MNIGGDKVGSVGKWVQDVKKYDVINFLWYQSKIGLA